MSRKSNVHLPSENELADILSVEVPRQLPIEKEEAHYPAFETVVQLFNAYSLPADIFTDNNLTIHQVVVRGAKLLDKAVDVMFKNTPTEDQTALFNACYDYLSEDDEPQHSDFIYVFGSRTLLRPQKAAELYAHGYSDHLIVSGGNPIYAESIKETEAALYQNYLIEHGVPSSAILTEEDSITVPDNVRRTLNHLDKNNITLSSIILVNSPYAQRRGWAIFKKHLPNSVSIHRVNSETSELYQKNKWYKQEDTLRVVLNEFIKMRASVVYNTA